MSLVLALITIFASCLFLSFYFVYLSQQKHKNCIFAALNYLLYIIEGSYFYESYSAVVRFFFIRISQDGESLLDTF